MSRCSARTVVTLVRASTSDGKPFGGFLFWDAIALILLGECDLITADV